MIGPRRHQIGIIPDISQRITEHTLYMAVEHLYSMGVKGDVVEFGTMTGSSAAALAFALKAFQDAGCEKRKLWLFDSFEGLPEVAAPADVNSPHWREKVWYPGLCVDMDPAELRSTMETLLPPELIDIRVGWFKDTLKASMHDSVVLPMFGVVHVDCDLYESTIDALDPLFQHGLLAHGALILFDDWNCNRGDPRYGERKAWSVLTHRHSIEASDEGGYGVAGHKFIVHSYK